MSCSNRFRDWTSSTISRRRNMLFEWFEQETAHCHQNSGHEQETNAPCSLKSHSVSAHHLLGKLTWVMVSEW